MSPWPPGNYQGFLLFYVSMKLLKSALFFALFLSSFAQAKVPACLDNKVRMDFNEGQVLAWKDVTEKKFSARAFVRGILVSVMEDRQKHIHFEVDLDKDLATQDDRIEVIYNLKFGPLPSFQEGDAMVICGDYVTDPYSAHKAVIHWLHAAPKKSNHDHGYLMINDTVAGLEVPEKENK